MNNRLHNSLGSLFYICCAAGILVTFVDSLVVLITQEYSAVGYWAPVAALVIYGLVASLCMLGHAVRSVVEHRE